MKSSALVRAAGNPAATVPEAVERARHGRGRGYDRGPSLAIESDQSRGVRIVAVEDADVPPVGLEAVDEPRQQYRARAIDGFERRQIEFDLRAAIQAALGLLHRTRHRRGVRQVEGAGRTETDTPANGLGPDDYAHRCFPPTSSSSNRSPPGTAGCDPDARLILPPSRYCASRSRVAEGLAPGDPPIPCESGALASARSAGIG